MSLFRKPSSPEASAAAAVNGPQLFLAAFGKHPGWDDHIDEIGLDTQALVEIKQILYVNGIPQQFGEWDKLDEQGRLPEFKHLFLWRRSTAWFFGRMWSSIDGKGRTRYPMIVCSQLVGGEGVDAARRVCPYLDELERDCKNARTADSVREVCGRHRESLRRLIGNPKVNTPAATDSTLVERLQNGPYDEPLLRIIYQVQTQMSAFARGAPRKAAEEKPRPQQIRVPSVPDLALDSALFWLRFFVSHTDPSADILITAPAGEPWTDVTLGEPGGHEFFSLRATPKALPLASEVPYNLDDAFRQSARMLLERTRNSGLPSTDAAGTNATVEESSTRRWLKSKLFGG